MKRLTFAFGLTLSLLGNLQSFGQSSDNRHLAIQYAKEANKLTLQNDPDSIAQAYALHTKALGFDKKHVPSYRSKISIAYKNGDYLDALNSAIAFVTNLPDFGDAWVYLGFIQAKLNDTTGATNSFERAINIYETHLKEIKDKNWKNQLRFQLGIVQQLLSNGKTGPVFNQKSSESKVTMNMGDTHSVNDYVEKFMTYNGVQFF